MLRIRTVLLFLSISLWGNLAAQEAPTNRFVNFGIKDGLPEKYIYGLTQDKKGYIWIGTGTGLFRYDGISFKPFRSPIDKSGSTISNILQAVYCDSSGYMWLGSLNDIQCFDPASNRFWRPVQNNTLMRKLGSYYTTRFSPGSNASLYIQTSYHFFYRFNLQDSSVTDFSLAFPSTASRITLNIAESGESIFAIHAEGIYRFSRDAKLQNFYPIPYQADALTNGIKGSEGIELTTFNHGVTVFDPKSGQYRESRFQNEQLKKYNLFTLIERNNEIWFGSYPLFKNNIDNQLTKFENKRISEYEITANKIGELLFDKEGNLWISSHNGLSMLPWQNQQIKTLPLIDLPSSALVEPSGVFNVPGSDDLLITNTSTRGLVYFDAKKNLLSIIQNPIEKDKYVQRIIGLIILKNGSVFASDDRHMFYFNPKSRKLVPVIMKDQDGKDLINVGRNISDKKGNVYISSINNGFYIWYPSTGILNHFDKTAADPQADTKNDNVLYPCFEDSREHIWFTSSTGVYEYLPKENKWNHYTGDDYKDVPPMTLTTYIAEDPQGHIWVTTQNNGLYEIFSKNNRTEIVNYGRNSGIGLNTDFCIKIKSDQKNPLFWLTTINGIHRFDPKEKKIIGTFTIQNGLAKEEGIYGYNITENNKIVILFYGLASIIDLNTYQFNKHPPQVEFSSIRAMDKELVYSHSDSVAIELDHNQNFLQFEFSALTYNNHNQLKYAYKLEGADKEWQYSDNLNKVTYSGLGSGKYTFKVKAANNDGVWSTNEKQVQIIILQPYWKTEWFLGILSAVIIGGLWLLYRYRLNVVRREEKLKTNFQQQIAEMEMRALRAQMNPHFIFNSLNSIQKYILKNDHFAASQYLTKFSRLIRLILDHSNQNIVLLSSEVELLQMYCEMESLRFNECFNFSIIVDPILNKENIEIPSMLIQPYVENAIWHGLLHKNSVGNLKISFSKNSNEYLLVTVEDDGIGRAKAMELKSKQVFRKKSYGMKITEDRIAIINRLNNIKASYKVTDLKDDEGNASGTQIELKIPLKPYT